MVVGGANMDISGRPDAPLVAQDSNPGKVRLSPGGVARNIAHNLALLGRTSSSSRPSGTSPHANQLAEGCRRLGIDVNDTLTVPGGTTSTYLFIADHTGEMQLAINEMDIYEELTPRFFESKMDLINRASLCVMDTNLPEESLRFLAENCRCPLFADTVSTVKAKKLAGLFYKIHTIKPNLLEAQLLTGIEIRDEDSLRRAARRFSGHGGRAGVPLPRLQGRFLRRPPRAVSPARLSLPHGQQHRRRRQLHGSARLGLAAGLFAAGLRQGRTGRGRHLHRKRRDDQSAHQRRIHPGNHGGAHTDPR